MFRIAFEDKECQFLEAETESTANGTQVNGFRDNNVQLDTVACHSFTTNQLTKCDNGENIPEDEKLTRNLIKASNWHLLSCCPLTFDKPRLLKDIKCDVLDKEGRSCLFYVLRKSSMDKLLSRFSLFNELIAEISDKTRKLIHFDGKSMTPEDFFYENYPEKFRGKLPDFRRCESYGQNESANECNAELKEICNEYHDDKALISLRLDRIKLTRIDGPIAIDLVKKAMQKKHWEVLVALINTYIVVHDQGKRPHVHGLINNDIFALKKSQYLQEICKEALKRPRCKTYFVPTAAEHILSIMDTKVRREMLSCIHRSTLPKETKARLEEIAVRDN